VYPKLTKDSCDVRVSVHFKQEFVRVGFANKWRLGVVTLSCQRWYLFFGICMANWSVFYVIYENRWRKSMRTVISFCLYKALDFVELVCWHCDERGASKHATFWLCGFGFLVFVVYEIWNRSKHVSSIKS